MLQLDDMVPSLSEKPGILSFTFTVLENAWILLRNWGKKWNFNLKLGKNLEICKFSVSRFTFQDVIYKQNLIYIFVVSTLST